MSFARKHREQLSSLIQDYDEYIESIEASIVKLEQLIEGHKIEIALLEDDLLETQNDYGDVVEPLRPVAKAAPQKKKASK